MLYHDIFFHVVSYCLLHITDTIYTLLCVLTKICVHWCIIIT